MTTFLLFLDGIGNGSAIAAAIGVVILLVRQNRLAEQVRAASRARPAAPRREQRPMIRVGDRWYHPTDQVTPAPEVDGINVRDMLVHLNPDRDNVWADVVREFYTRGLGVPAVAAYFYRTDRNRQEGHFLRALDLVASKGLTAGTIDFLRRKHGTITTPDGKPITGDVYDAVIGTLVDVLAAAGLPPQARAALAETIKPLRAEIVRG